LSTYKLDTILASREEILRTEIEILTISIIHREEKTILLQKTPATNKSATCFPLPDQREAESGTTSGGRFSAQCADE